LKKHLNILFLIVLLIGLGWKGYAQDLPVACGGSFATYGVYGDNGNSFFEWEVQGGDIIRNYNDSIIVNWHNIGGARVITVKETNIYGCEGEPFRDTVLVTVPFVDLGLDAEVCEGESYEFFASANNAASYLWQDSTNGETFIATEQGNYWVKITDEYGCIGSDTASLIVNQAPDIDLGPDTVNCGEDELILDAYAENAASYEWWTADATLPQSSSTYEVPVLTRDQEIWVNVYSDKGCFASDTIVVRFCGDFEIPNTFTPNDDKSNDIWRIEALFSFSDVTVDIYNRWGERVFHSNGYSSDQYWDGTDQKGKKLPMDSYYYVIDLNNGEEPIVGTVTIIR